MRSTATQKARSTDYSRRDALVLEHLPLVIGIASRIRQSMPVHLDSDDLFHSGIIGLFDAAERFDETKDIGFATYAKFRIRGAILDSLRDLDTASRDVRRRQKQMDEVIEMLTIKLERVPTEAEIAEAMGISLNRWRHLQVELFNVHMIASQQRNKECVPDSPPDEPACSPDTLPDNIFAKAEARKHMQEALQELPPRYREVMTLYYEKDLNMKEIGQVMGVKESRVSQIHSASLARLQTQLVARGIRSAA